MGPTGARRAALPMLAALLAAACAGPPHEQWPPTAHSCIAGRRDVPHLLSARLAVRDHKAVVHGTAVRLFACWLPPGGTDRPAHLSVHGEGVVAAVEPADIDVPSTPGQPSMVTLVARTNGDGKGTVVGTLTFPLPGAATSPDFQNIGVHVTARKGTVTARE